MAFFKLPPTIPPPPTLQPFYQPIIPIPFILIIPLSLYKIPTKTPQFPILQHSIPTLSPHQPLQLLFIPFVFNRFLQRPPPFPLPIAISPLLLTQ
ncbi:L-lactate permease, partial [Staphylococcus saprophyticus]|uniref:L-lactate permease n=1 Tax=Staphylococcus saprophyticus TaxID=29385 RepID=UPI001642E3B3